MAKRKKESDCEACENAIRELQRLVAQTEGIDRARALILLGDAATMNFRAELALAAFGAALDLLPTGEFPDLESEALFKESCALAGLERFEEALQRVRAAKSICESQNDDAHLALCEWRQGMYCAELARNVEAVALIERARDRYRSLPGFEDMVVCVELDLDQAIRLRDGTAATGKRRNGRKRSKSP
jgi:tetratricopeptide (TPR) repeat protein